MRPQDLPLAQAKADAAEQKRITVQERDEAEREHQIEIRERAVTRSRLVVLSLLNLPYTNRNGAV